MPRHDPLPRALTFRPFSVADGFAAGATKKRLLGPDLDRPFRGIRTPKSFRTVTAQDDLSLTIRRCSEYAPRLLPGQYFSHLTAAVLWRMPLPRHVAPTDPLHVTSTIPRNAPRSVGIAGHRAPPATIHTRFGFPVSSPEDTWLALASIFSADELIVAADALVLDPEVLDPRDIRPYSTIENLIAAFDSFAGRGKRAAAEALPQIRQGAESPRETLLRLLAVRAGYPEPVLQAQILDADGRFIARGDMFYPEYRTVFEYDGQQHRTDDVQYESDLGRSENIKKADYEHVRITKRRFRSPRMVIALLDEALRRRGWRG